MVTPYGKKFSTTEETLLTEPRVLRVSSKIDVQARSGDELTRRLRHTGGSRYPSRPRLDAGLRRHDVL